MFTETIYFKDQEEKDAFEAWRASRNSVESE